ncbi:branched-chain amino acid ABC transporter permease [Halobacterium litoreum]|uniref:Branched-chain amino acid ABC transporter permease n=1 Tax=Halobacterium litoreum TaxID=2039234 RepID=A0ABD5NBS6_9EURY|nr:branched-chain amino acid ABC transporter permease [Halobacterium litoreum]UHH14525.1 branched-chain amino acid ABC transporter permease [Halobacterium litoreum]
MTATVAALDATAVFEVFVNGLAKASLYAMMALGLTLIFGLLGVLNFAHGSLTMLGAYVAGLVMVTFSGGGTAAFAWFFLAAVVAAVLVGGVGAAMEVGLIRKLYDRPPVYQILLTFGVTLVIDELARIVVLFYGVQPRADWRAALSTKPPVMGQSVDVLGASVGNLQLFQIAWGVLTVAAVWAFLNRTRYGLVVRAGSEDDEMAAALGVDVRRVFTVVFALGAALAGFAGALLMWDSVWGASVPLASETLLPAFVVVIVGGLGSFRGTVVAALLVGMVDAVMTYVFNQGIVTFSGLPELTVFLILVGVLVVRPQGISGLAEVGGH